MDGKTWQDALNELSERQKEIMICYLLGRSQLTDEEFIIKCQELFQ